MAGEMKQWLRFRHAGATSVNVSVEPAALAASGNGNGELTNGRQGFH